MAKGIDKKGVTTWIAATAQKLGYNHAYLASKTGISKFTIGSFLTGARAPRLDHLQKLCKVFGVEADDIAREYGYYPKPNRKTDRIRKSAAPMAVVPKTEEKKEENTMPTNTIIAEVPRPTEKPVNTRNSGEHNYNPNNGLTKEGRTAISKWIRTLVKESGLNLREYGELVGIKGNTLSAYTRGTSGPSIQRPQAICKLHGIDWKVAACYFGYHDYKAPDYWLGKDYKTNEDWLRIHKVMNDEPSATKCIAKQAAKPKSDMDALKARIAELEQQNADILAERNNVEANWQQLNAELREQKEELRKRLGEVSTELKKRIDLCEVATAEAKELREQNAKLGKAVDTAVRSNEVEKYLLGLKHYICEALPKAESVEVTCPGGADICWKIKLPGMENALAGHLSVDAFAGTIAKGVKDEVLSRFGLN